MKSNWWIKNCCFDFIWYMNEYYEYLWIKVRNLKPQIWIQIPTNSYGHVTNVFMVAVNSYRSWIHMIISHMNSCIWIIHMAEFIHEFLCIETFYSPSRPRGRPSCLCPHHKGAVACWWNQFIPCLNCSHQLEGRADCISLFPRAKGVFGGGMVAGRCTLQGLLCASERQVLLRNPAQGAPHCVCSPKDSRWWWKS